MIGIVGRLIVVLVAISWYMAVRWLLYNKTYDEGIDGHKGVWTSHFWITVILAIPITAISMLAVLVLILAARWVATGVGP